MKKLLFITMAVSVISACACFDCSDEQEQVQVRTYRIAQEQPKMDCDYFDGRTCYRYIYRQVQKPVARPIRYRESRPCQTCQPAPVVYAQPKANCGTCASCNPCQEKVTETREPVEVVYKKTTNRTVYEPKTYSEVSYEKVSCMNDDCANMAQPEQIEVID